ncbi:MAG: carbohydrate ABC transporter permease [Oscillospiraceae bacterium]
MKDLKTVKKNRARLSFACKVLIGIAFIFPLIICLLFSFQPESELGTFPLRLFTANPTLSNFAEVFRSVPLLHFLKNSLVVCLITITSQVVLSSFAAYAFVFFEFPGKNLLFSIILASMMIPGDIVIITNFLTVQNMGLLNSYAGLALPSLISGTAIFMMRQYYRTLPKDFKEAAIIDCCSDMGFLFRIALPLSVPTIAALSIYLFVGIYNQYFWPMLVTNKNSWRTIQVGIGLLVQGDTLQYGHLLAGALVCIVPPVLLFIFGQDYIIKGMTSGGVKG